MSRALTQIRRKNEDDSTTSIAAQMKASLNRQIIRLKFSRD